MKVLMSIKPKYVNMIMNGTKKFELRKKFPNGIDDVDEVYVYSTSPVQKVVGKFNVKYVHVESDYKALWNLTTNNGAYPEKVGVTFEEFEEYFKNSSKCFAIEIGKIEKFATPRTLKDFNIGSAPQSWCYLKRSNL